MSRQPKQSPPAVPDTRLHWQKSGTGTPSASADAEQLYEERVYSLLTPLFGGGVTPRFADPISRLRVTGIRGQLRFWWRATRGVGSLAEVRKREAEIWGAASNDKDARPSQVQLALVQVAAGAEERPFKLQGRDPAPNFSGVVTPHYAAFPLQPGTEELKKAARPEELFAPVLKDVTFTLRLRYPATLKAEVAAALWAWETFGGVGARTRRGFGAPRLNEWRQNGRSLDPKSQRPAGGSSQAFNDWLTGKLKEHVLAGERHPQLPHIPHVTKLGQQKRWRFIAPAEVKSQWEILQGAFTNI